MMKLFAFEKSVGAVVFREVNDQGKFLILHYNSGHWDFPKGHVEKGETEEQTLTREVFEETGIQDLEIVSGFRKSIYYSYRPGKEERFNKNRARFVFKKVVFYVAKTESLEVSISQEHKGFEWMGFEEAMQKITHGEGKDLLKNAEEFLTNSFLR